MGCIVQIRDPRENNGEPTMTHRTLRTPVLPSFFALMLAALWLVSSARPALAAGVVGDGTPGSCDDNAITAAFMAGSGTITFNCGAAPLTISANTHVVSAGENFVVDGNNKITLDGMDARQLFLVQSGGTLTLRNITLTRGGFSSGSVVRNNVNGDLTLRNVIVTNSGTDADDGGAIYNAGLLEVELSTFDDNQARRRGGAIFNAAGATASVRTSTLRGNRVKDPVGLLGDGGGIYNLGALTVDRSTLFANRAKRHGGGIFTATGSATVTNSTLAENSADYDAAGDPVVITNGQGGGIHVGAGTGHVLLNETNERHNIDKAGGIWVGGPVSMKNTIVSNSSNSADNGVASLNCDNPGISLVSNGHNLISDGSCVDGSNLTDKRNINPMLSFINPNGGPTDTLLPLTGSPVIDAGDDAGCPALDQRGVVRPVGLHCDIGAVEFRLIDNGNGVYLPLVHK